jgi:hypothetical protein
MPEVEREPDVERAPAEAAAYTPTRRSGVFDFEAPESVRRAA